jgi:hypothetical protein
LSIAHCRLSVVPIGPFFAASIEKYTMDKKNNFSTRQQSHSHKEGQMDNVTPQQSGTGQRVSENKSQAMGDMLNDNDVPSPERGGDGENDNDAAQKGAQP